jgi:hypothetical protein
VIILAIIKGEYRVLYSLVASQDKYKSELLNLELFDSYWRNIR